MVRLLSVILVAGLVVASTPTIRTVSDDFSSGGYTGGTGWTGPWVEINDDSDPSSGNVRVATGSNCGSGPCLVLSALLDVGDFGASRSFDSSDAESAQLSYRISFPSLPLLGGSIRVQHSLEGGPFQTLATHSPGTVGSFAHAFPVGGASRVRFVTFGLGVGLTAGIDDVVIDLMVPPPPTATTTTTTTTATTTPTPSPTTTSTATATASTTTPASTTTTADPARPTTTTLPPDRTTTTVSQPDPGGGGTGDPGNGSGGDATDRPPRVVEPLPDIADTFGVITRITPAMGPRQLQVQVHQGFVVGFGSSAESLALDLTANAIMGAILALALVRRYERPRDGLSEVEED